jgi:hypothetical protein
LAALPIVSWLSSSEATVSNANSQLHFVANLPGHQENITVDFADYESTLDFMGNALLAMVSLFYTIWLFRGRND